MTQLSQPAQPSQPAQTIDVDATPPLLPQVVQYPLGGPCKNHYGKACLITRGTVFDGPVQTLLVGVGLPHRYPEQLTKLEAK